MFVLLIPSFRELAQIVPLASEHLLGPPARILKVENVGPVSRVN